MQRPEEHAREVICAERQRLGMSQVELARKVADDTRHWDQPVDIHGTAITRLERGIRGIGLDEAVAIANTLGLTLHELIGEDPIDERARQRRANADHLLDLVSSLAFLRTDGFADDPQWKESGR